MELWFLLNLYERNLNMTWILDLDENLLAQKGSALIISFYLFPSYYFYLPFFPASRNFDGEVHPNTFLHLFSCLLKQHSPLRPACLRATIIERGPAVFIIHKQLHLSEKGADVRTGRVVLGGGFEHTLLDKGFSETRYPAIFL